MKRLEKWLLTICCTLLIVNYTSNHISNAVEELDLLIWRISLPVKKSKEDKVKEVAYDIWGSEADKYAKSKNMDATNWADSGWVYVVDSNDVSKTSAVYCVTMKQTLFRGSEKNKRDEWTAKIGTDNEFYVTNSYGNWLQDMNLIPITNNIEEIQ